MSASSLPPEPIIFTPECEIFKENQPENGPVSEYLYNHCKKNPGHERFIPMEKFKKEDLPPGWQSEEMMECVRIHYDLTVRIIIEMISPNRPDTYPQNKSKYPYSKYKGEEIVMTGTGSIVVPKLEDGSCPCHECIKSELPKMKYWSFLVYTATHVIYDDFEAAIARFECFYDSESREGVGELFGVRVIRPRDETTRAYTDKCQVLCVTHDLELGRKLSDLCEKQPSTNYLCDNDEAENKYGIMVSHPHGRCKKITVGNMIYDTVLTGSKMPTDVPHTIDCGLRCRLPLFPWSDYYGYVIPQADVKKDTGGPTSSDASSCCVHVPPSLICGVPVVPGTEFELPPGMTFTLPPNTLRAYEVRIVGTRHWLTFATGTVLKSTDGDVICFPPETEFALSDEDKFAGMFSLRKYRCATYDVVSCPGSSGAGITNSRKYFSQHQTHHSGALRGGRNLSGLVIDIPLPMPQ